ncbi:MAG: FMN-binding protein [Candidatus Omnitrophota bacterium]|jgi:Na+-translocating ferredoxin:NAD+ oxidoreductase RnfG subunit|nr:FMN-binding protein [Candidatus Omnitrophota bacterium]
MFSYAEVYLDTDELLKDMLSASETIEGESILLSRDEKEVVEKRLGNKISEESFTFYTGKTNGKVDSSCLIISETGKHGPVTFIIAITQEGKIRDIGLLEHREVKGGNIGSRRFLKQFVGKTSRDPIKLKKDIDAVTGATVSSKAATKAVKKALVIWEEVFKPRF